MSRLTEEDIRRLEDLASTDGPLDWVPVGRDELRELLQIWRGQQAMKDGAKRPDAYDQLRELQTRMTLSIDDKTG